MRGDGRTRRGKEEPEPQVAGRPVEGSVLDTEGKKREAYGVQCCRCWVVKRMRAWSPEGFKQ